MLSHISSSASRCILRYSPLAHWLVLVCHPFKDFHGTITRAPWKGEVALLQDDHGFPRHVFVENALSLTSLLSPDLYTPRLGIIVVPPRLEITFDIFEALHLGRGEGCPTDFSLPLPLHSGSANEPLATPLSCPHQYPETVMKWK